MSPISQDVFGFLRLMSQNLHYTFAPDAVRIINKAIPQFQSWHETNKGTKLLLNLVFLKRGSFSDWFFFLMFIQVSFMLHFWSFLWFSSLPSRWRWCGDAGVVRQGTEWFSFSSELQLFLVLWHPVLLSAFIQNRVSCGVTNHINAPETPRARVRIHAGSSSNQSPWWGHQ